MNTKFSPAITVEVNINAPVEKVWEYFTTPVHITQWNNASPDWHTPSAENDLRVGGKFNYRMEAKSGSFGFNFEGVYDEVKTIEMIAYTMADGRKVIVEFSISGNETNIKETFDPENENPIELQRDGWKAILDNFRKYVEAA